MEFFSDFYGFLYQKRHFLPFLSDFLLFFARAHKKKEKCAVRRQQMFHVKQNEQARFLRLFHVKHFIFGGFIVSRETLFWDADGNACAVFVLFLVVFGANTGFLKDPKRALNGGV